jgi:hypothetical protein
VYLLPSNNLSSFWQELYFFEQGKDPSKSEALNDSVMFQTWPKLDKYSNSIVEQQFKTVRRIRDTVFATVEKARAVSHRCMP